MISTRRVCEALSWRCRRVGAVLLVFFVWGCSTCDARRTGPDPSDSAADAAPGPGDAGPRDAPDDGATDTGDEDAFVCSHGGGPDLCDGIDNDCNPATEDGSGDVRVGASCTFPSVVGCDAVAAAWRCSGSAWQCMPAHGPTIAPRNVTADFTEPATWPAVAKTEDGFVVLFATSSLQGVFAQRVGLDGTPSGEPVVLHPGGLPALEAASDGERIVGAWITFASPDIAVASAVLEADGTVTRPLQIGPYDSVGAVSVAVRRERYAIAWLAQPNRSVASYELFITIQDFTTGEVLAPQSLGTVAVLSPIALGLTATEDGFAVVRGSATYSELVIVDDGGNTLHNFELGTNMPGGAAVELGFDGEHISAVMNSANSLRTQYFHPTDGPLATSADLAGGLAVWWGEAALATTDKSAVVLWDGTMIGGRVAPQMSVVDASGRVCWTGEVTCAGSETLAEPLDPRLDVAVNGDLAAAVWDANEEIWFVSVAAAACE